MSGSTSIVDLVKLATRVVRVLRQDVAGSTCRAGAQDGKK